MTPEEHYHQECEKRKVRLPTKSEYNRLRGARIACARCPACSAQGVFVPFVGRRGKWRDPNIMCSVCDYAWRSSQRKKLLNLPPRIISP